MRIGNNIHHKIDEAHSREIAKGQSARKGITKRSESTVRHESDSEVRQLVEQMRGISEDRGALVAAVKQRLLAGAYDTSDALEATAKSIFSPPKS